MQPHRTHMSLPIALLLGVALVVTPACGDKKSDAAATEKVEPGADKGQEAQKSDKEDKAGEGEQTAKTAAATGDGEGEQTAKPVEAGLSQEAMAKLVVVAGKMACARKQHSDAEALKAAEDAILSEAGLDRATFAEQDKQAADNAMYQASVKQAVTMCTTANAKAASEMRNKLKALAVASQCLAKQGKSGDEMSQIMLAQYKAYGISVSDYAKEMAKLTNDRAFQDEIRTAVDKCPAAPPAAAAADAGAAPDAAAAAADAGAAPAGGPDAQVAMAPKPDAGSAQPGAQPAQPDGAGDLPGSQPPQPGAQPGQPGAQPGQPGQPGAQPGQPGQPGAQPGQPGAQPGQPGAQPGQPGAQPGQPTTPPPGPPAGGNPTGPPPPNPPPVEPAKTGPNYSGTWSGQFGGKKRGRLTIRVRGKKVTATAVLGSSRVSAKGRITGNSIRFSGRRARTFVRFNGKIKGRKMSGKAMATMQIGGRYEGVRGSWSARKK